MDVLSTGLPTPSSPSRRYLLAELTVLFIAVPLAGALVRWRWHVRLPILPSLWVLTLICLAMLLGDDTFDRRRLLGVSGQWPGLRRILIRFAALATLLSLAVLHLAPEWLFSLVRRRPAVWAMVMVGYPVLSAYPQSVVYRAFAFHRYRRLVPNGTGRWALSAVLFALAHVVFANPLAIVLTLVGGALFGWTYQRTGSVLLSAIEHALYGLLLFTLGLGWVIYQGTPALMQRALGG